jgi:hypothetical protein
MEGQMSETAEQNNPPQTKVAKPVPLLLEVSFTATRILLIVAGLLTGGISVLSGATWIASAVRAGSAVLSVGLLLFLANWVLSRDSLEAARVRLLKEIAIARAAQADELAAGMNTIEKQA